MNAMITGLESAMSVLKAKLQIHEVVLRDTLERVEKGDHLGAADLLRDLLDKEEKPKKKSKKSVAAASVSKPKPAPKPRVKKAKPAEVKPEEVPLPESSKEDEAPEPTPAGSE